MTFCRCGYSSGVERNLAKVDVVGPNPIARSNYKKSHLYGGFFCNYSRRRIRSHEEVGPTTRKRRAEERRSALADCRSERSDAK